MRAEGATTVPLAPDAVWGILSDPGRLARHMPGAGELVQSGDGAFTLDQSVALGVGTVRLRWAFDPIGGQAGEQARLRGTARGDNLLVHLDAAFRLSPAGAGTDVRWEADVRLSGGGAALAAKVAKPVLQQQVGELLRAFHQEAGAAAGRGAEAGIHPGAPEAYAGDPSGPTHDAA